MADYVHVPADVKRYIHNFEIESHRESKWPRDAVPAFITMRKLQDRDVVRFTPVEARMFAAVLEAAANDAEKKP